MEVKKSPKADLEKKKTTGLLIGYVLALAVMFIAFEWSERDKVINIDTGMGEFFFEEEIIPITEQEEQKTPPPPPEAPKAEEIIEIAENDANVEETTIQASEFPGGMAECMKWLSKNMKYPTISQENGVQGRVIVQFVVNRDGSIVDAVVARGVDPYLDKEALRVVGLMPKWKPGKQRGKEVRVKYTLPVMFRLQ